jgi:hypothetical protein
MRAGSAARRLGSAALACAILSWAAGVAAADARVRVPNTWPFAPPSGLRKAKPRDALPSLWRDGRPCSTGCRARGAVPGWPVKPFHRQHLLRAGLNELRPGNLHSGVDILARDGTPVYAIQPGRARVLERRGRDARVRVGDFEYWHIRPRVAEGQAIHPYREVLGTIVSGASHVHLSELRGNANLNPLRPGGRVLAPWRDTGAPVLSRPRLLRGRRVLIQGFDPQGSRRTRRPALALAGLAYRLFDARGRRVGRLRWALRGTRQLAGSLRRRIYAPGSRPSFATCIMRPRHPCRSRWVYRLAGGLAPRLGVRDRRVYRLTAYAWDWAGHVRAVDTRLVYVRGEPFVAAGR